MEEDVLSENDLKAREVTLAKAQYEAIDGVLYHVEQDNTLQIVLPTVDRRKVFDEAHNGVYGAHLREAKIHGQLSKHYWWQCEVCASHSTGLVTKPPLNSIPVAGLFDRIGVSSAWEGYSITNSWHHQC